MVEKSRDVFAFVHGDIVLAKYAKEIFYAKILSINYTRGSAMLLFDDNSKDEVKFDNIFSVNETTADIICVICKNDKTEEDDDIVLCDICSVGFHQKCHMPHISSDKLLPDIPWQCFYCENNKRNPHVQANPFEEMKTKEKKMETILSEDDVRPSNIKNDVTDETRTNDLNDDDYDDNNKAQDEDRNRLNHHDSSPFEEIKGNSKCVDFTKNITTRPCSHHDMVGNISYQLALEKNEKAVAHCEHSDKFKKVHKSRKINRVSPFIHHEESDSLVIVPEKQIERANRRPDKNDNAISPSQSRFINDLPRHNWLVERLKQENKIDDNDINSSLNGHDKNLKDKNIRNFEFDKDRQKTSSHETLLSKTKFPKQTNENKHRDYDGQDIKIVKVESLNKDKRSNEISDTALIEFQKLRTTTDLSSHFTRSSQETIQAFSQQSKQTKLQDISDETL